MADWYKNYYSTNEILILFIYFSLCRLRMPRRFRWLLNMVYRSTFWTTFSICTYVHNSCTFFAFETFAENFKYKCNKFSLCVVSVTETQHNRYICRLAIVCSLFTSVSHELVMPPHLWIIYYECFLYISCVYQHIRNT